HAGAVEGVVYSLDGQYLVSILRSLDSYNTLCWDPESGLSVCRLELSGVNVRYLSFSPTGNPIAALGYDGQLRLWHLESGKWLNGLNSKAGSSRGLRWMQHGDCMYSATAADQFLRVWKLVERDSTYNIQLVWGTGLKRLSMVDVSMDDVVGLSPVNLELMTQHGAITQDTDN
ncbi:hypothetical protein BGX29_002417, partial [Mortierella sp. GBA35]